MKRFLLLLIPALLILLAFRPVKMTTVTGTVNDESGTPVVGASVMIKGTRTGTSTSADGKYSIQVSSAGDVLAFSAVGYQTT